MLASLLPGFRDLRTPLACGVTWLLAAFFFVHDSIPTEHHAHGLPGTVYQLHALVGTPALAAITIAFAYLIGVVLPLDPVQIWADALGTRRVGRWLTRLLIEWRRRRHLETLSADELKYLARPRGKTGEVPWMLSRAMFGRAGHATLLGYATWRVDADSMAEARDALREVMGIYIPPDRSEDNFMLYERGDYKEDVIREGVVTAIAMQLSQLVARLRIQPIERLFDSYDRKDSEAMFRTRIAIPLAALTAAVAASDHHLWLLGLVAVPIYLVRQGRHLTIEARLEIAEALNQGIIEAPIIERIKEMKPPREAPTQER